MKDLSFEQMQQMQVDLQAKYKDKWPALSPDVGRDKLLWMLAEAGEIADVIKKQSDSAIINDSDVRSHFIEELCDTMMYFNDVMLCYGITPEELHDAYVSKHKINMKRW